jgi:hypothetical protein
MSEEQKPERLPFDAEFFTAANDFSTNVMARVPELQGVAIIPVWAIAVDKIPSGILRFSPEVRAPFGPLYHTLGQLATFGVDVHQKLAEELGHYDKYAKKLADEIKALEQKRDQLKEAADSDNG